MSDPVLISGSAATLLLNLKDLSGAAVNIAAATEVKVAITTLDRATRLAGPYTASSGTAQANWSAGTVAVVVPALDSAAITAVHVSAQTRVVLGGVTTHYFSTLRLQVITDHNA